MSTCIICLNGNRYPLCLDCKKNPFLVEDVRKILAEKSELKTLFSLYSTSLPVIKDLNTGKYWDKKLEKVNIFSQQDGMTKDRVRIAYSYIPAGARKILDIGAGYGFIEELLQKDKKYKLHGIDISFKGIKLLKKRFKGEFRVATAEKIPYRDNFFDVVLALEILEHIKPGKIFSVLREVNRVLTLNGVFILSIPLNEGLRNKNENPSGHLRDYSKNLIKTELRLSGFEVVEYKELFAFSKYYNIKKYLRKFILKSRWQPNDLVIKAIKI